ncbi:ParB/RepB/Spo0J family partition protein [Nocardia terpenica]|uniref:Streptomycin biosynthesis protein n=1 Tax=Nocardia terpenica TaxID=455432 RepID=A0A291REY9_9NOCA|nr:ParB N-terminal domain-containing protein [Nocardia terpenica]ATL65704.1 streptomycin biosynthesis protein [Nocardia terpenica]
MADGNCVDPSCPNEADIHHWLSRAASIPVEQVPVESIAPGYSPRSDAGTNADHIRVLTEAEVPLPAIIVHRPSMRVIDGAHRLQAARATGKPTIAVKFFDGTEEDAFALAVQANVAHGLPLSLAERKAAARRLIASHPGWSDRLIAGTTGLSHKTVGALRRSDGEVPHLNGRMGRDGRLRPVEIAAARRTAEEFIERNPQASLREISKRAGISLGTAKAVRDRMARPLDKAVRRGTAGRPAVPAEKVSVLAPPADRAAAAVTSLPEEIVRRTAGASIQQIILRSLRNDPALRLKDNGRALLRRLAISVMNINEWDELTTDVPVHCRGSLAQLARANARSWQELAHKLENPAIRDRRDA